MKEKTAKIVMITSLSVIGVLILSILLLAVISVDRGFKFNQNPDTIVLHNGSSSVVLYSDKIEEQDGVFTQVLNKVDGAGKFKVLDSMFGGYSSKTDGTEYLSSSVTFSTLYSTSGEYCIEYRWHAAQKINYTNNEGTKVEYSYDRAYFKVSQENAVTKVSAYLRAANTSNTYSRVVYYGYLNTSDLYDYVSNISYNA